MPEDDVTNRGEDEEHREQHDEEVREVVAGLVDGLGDHVQPRVRAKSLEESEDQGEGEEAHAPPHGLVEGADQEGLLVDLGTRDERLCLCSEFAMSYVDTIVIEHLRVKFIGYALIFS